MAWPRRAKGFTLIEVLVAMGILSVGVLGTASLQAKALRYVQVASQQSLAAQLGKDLVGRMRANSKDAATQALYLHESHSDALEGHRNCATQPCTGEQLVAHYQRQLQLEAVAERNLLLAERSIESIPLDVKSFDFSMSGDGFYNSVGGLLALDNWSAVSTNISLLGVEGRHEYIVEYLGNRVHLGLAEPFYRVTIRSQFMSGGAKILQSTITRAGRREAWTDVLEP